METASAWVFAGELPSSRVGLRGANIDNKILMTGKYNDLQKKYILQIKIYIGGFGEDFLDEILEFDPVTEKWTEVGNLKHARGVHAVSVINFQPDLCA